MPPATRVVFLIDEQSIMEANERMEQIKKAMMRILLYYLQCYRIQQAQSGPHDVFWGYGLFNTKARCPSRSMRHLYPVGGSMEGFDTLEDEYRSREAERKAKSLNSSDISETQTAPSKKIVEVLRDSLGEFQWEVDDETTAQYVFVITPSPHSKDKLRSYFEYDNRPVRPAHFNPHFKRFANDLKQKFSQEFQRRNLILSFIDSNYKLEHFGPQQPNFVDFQVENGMKQVAETFNGRYILLQDLVRPYDLYGHSFFSELHNRLPTSMAATTKSKKGRHLSTVTIPLEQQIKPDPIWSGTFSIQSGKSLGEFNLCPALRDQLYEPFCYWPYTELRIVRPYALQEFDHFWLYDPRETGGYSREFILEFAEGDSPALYDHILDECHYRQMVLVAEMVPLDGKGSLPPVYMVIEPLSRMCATARELKLKSLPPMPSSHASFYSNKVVVKTEDVQTSEACLENEYPLGTLYSVVEWPTKTDHLIEEESKEDDEDNCTTKYDLIAPEHIRRAVLDKINNNLVKSEALKRQGTQDQVEDIIETDVPLPKTVPSFIEMLSEYYYECLYLKEYNINEFYDITNHFINHLLKQDVQSEDIVRALDISLASPYRERLALKYRPSELHHLAKINRITGEDKYIVDWWQEIHDYRDEQYLNNAWLFLTIRDVTLQIILHMFNAKISKSFLRVSKIAERCDFVDDLFQDLVTFFQLHQIPEPEDDQDNDDPTAIAYDVLNDIEYAKRLSEWFKEDLPDLADSIQEAAGLNVIEEKLKPLEEIEASIKRQESDVKIERTDEEQMIGIGQKRRRSDEIQYDEPELLETRKKTKTPVATTSTTMATKKKPAQMQRQSSIILSPKRPIRSASESKLAFMTKRSVSVTPGVSSRLMAYRGEAALAAMDKVERSKINGVPTMKRVGGFMVSNRPDKLLKTSHKRNNNSDNGDNTHYEAITIRRRPNNNPDDTPRTSLSRFLGLDICEEYRETAVSPSNRTNRNSSANLDLSSGKVYEMDDGSLLQDTYDRSNSVLSHDDETSKAAGRAFFAKAKSDYVSTPSSAKAKIASWFDDSDEEEVEYADE